MSISMSGWCAISDGREILLRAADHCEQARHARLPTNLPLNTPTTASSNS